LAIKPDHSTVKSTMPLPKETKRFQDRRLKVVRAFGRELRPCLPLKGLWLAQAGFAIGSRVRVEVEFRRLTITLLDSPEEGA